MLVLVSTSVHFVSRELYQYPRRFYLLSVVPLPGLVSPTLNPLLLCSTRRVLLLFPCHLQASSLVPWSLPIRQTCPARLPCPLAISPIAFPHCQSCLRAVPLPTFFHLASIIRTVSCPVTPPYPAPPDTLPPQPPLHCYYVRIPTCRPSSTVCLSPNLRLRP